MEPPKRWLHNLSIDRQARARAAEQVRTAEVAVRVQRQLHEFLAMLETARKLPAMLESKRSGL